jgi:hypothetical protein
LVDRRRAFVGGIVLVTAGVEMLPNERRRLLLKKVREFEDLTAAAILTANTISAQSKTGPNMSSGKSTPTIAV